MKHLRSQKIAEDEPVKQIYGLCGFCKNEPVPDRSTVARFQYERLAGVIEDSFYQLTDKSVRLGETVYENIFVDGTKQMKADYNVQIGVGGEYIVGVGLVRNPTATFKLFFEWCLFLHCVEMDILGY